MALKLAASLDRNPNYSPAFYFRDSVGLFRLASVSFGGPRVPNIALISARKGLDVGSLAAPCGDRWPARWSTMTCLALASECQTPWRVKEKIYRHRAAEHTELNDPRYRHDISRCAPRLCGNILLPFLHRIQRLPRRSGISLIQNPIHRSVTDRFSAAGRHSSGSPARVPPPDLASPDQLFARRTPHRRPPANGQSPAIPPDRPASNRAHAV
jgi:hypothetical protein